MVEELVVVVIMVDGDVVEGDIEVEGVSAGKDGSGGWPSVSSPLLTN